MLTLMVLLVAAAAAHAIAVRRRLPSIPVLIATGLLLKAAGVLDPLAAKDADTLRDALVLGLTFLVFVVGAELDPAIVGRWRGPAIVFGVAQFLFIGLCGTIAAFALDAAPRTAACIGVAVASSSTLVVVAMLRRREQVFEDVGRMALGVVLVQDLLVVLALPVVTGEDASTMATGFVATLALGGVAVAVGRWAMPAVVASLERHEEPLLLLVLGTLFGFAGLADLLGVPPAVGAFLAGVMFARHPVQGLVRGPMASLAHFFVAVFFIALGASVVLTDLRQVALDGLIIASVLLLAPILLVPLAVRSGLTTRASIELTGLLAQCGELGLAVMLVGLAHGVVDERAFATIVVVAAATMLAAPALSSDAATWRIMHGLSRLRRRPGPGLPDDLEDHAVFIGCGSATRRLIAEIGATGRSVIAVDDDQAVVDALRREGVPAMRGDGANPWLLRRLGLRRAAIIVSTMRRRRDQVRLLQLAVSTPVVLRVFDPGAARALADAAGPDDVIVCEAEAAESALLEHLDADAGIDRPSPPAGVRRVSSRPRSTRSR